MVIYGCPTSGKTTAFKMCLDKGINAIDTDYPYTLWTTFGDGVPEELRGCRKISASASEYVKSVIRERIFEIADRNYAVIVFTNFTLRRPIFEFGFGRDFDALMDGWNKRGDNFKHPDLTLKIRNWSSDSLSMARYCKSFTVLGKGEYISNDLQRILAKYKAIY